MHIIKRVIQKKWKIKKIRVGTLLKYIQTLVIGPKIPRMSR